MYYDLCDNRWFLVTIWFERDMWRWGYSRYCSVNSGIPEYSFQIGPLQIYWCG